MSGRDSTKGIDISSLLVLLLPLLQGRRTYSIVFEYSLRIHHDFVQTTKRGGGRKV